ncbi:unnamed protein product [Colias eurytheme]|nr:unnamed protein product [Colias eurytheme]
MDCFVKTSAEKEAIYEIYRSCRLCGGGAGYKMPIIQNVVNITTDDVELKDKIRECVQIEVSQDDKMPPLICELCVDKISDFYDFLEMCRRTNKRTRLRLGLPPQALVRDAPDAGDCILGITEPVYVKKETNTSNTKKKGKVIKGKDFKVKKEPVVPVKQEKPKGLSKEVRELLISSKSDKVKKAEAMTRRNTKPEKIQEKVRQEKLKGISRELQELLNSSKSDKIKKTEAMSRRNTKPEKIQEKVPKTRTVTEPEPKSILKRRDDSSSSNTLKRTRDKEVQKKSDVQPKKVKIVETRATRTSCPDIVDDDNDDVIENKVPCKICKKKYHIGVSLNNHMRTHKVPEKTIHKCNKCKKTFATSKELDRHKCVTESKRTTTLECKYCKRPFNSKARMHGHMPRCNKRKSTTLSSIVIQPSVKKRLKPLHVRTVRCDPILVERDNGHFDVSRVVCPYGLDKNCVYPYQNKQRTSLLSEDKMVVIRDDITNSFELEDYVHWDSDSGTDESDIHMEKRRKVDSLSSIALKTIFSEKCLGKVPKKKRKVKMENAFDSILNASEVDSDFRLDIDSIIHNLGDDKSERDSVSIKILNVFSQKETDYDSDRTSFNDEFDTVQSNTSNLKSSLSFNKDINDDTSTNSIDSIAETSILQNLKGDELKTLLDTDTTLNLEEKVKNDNLTDSDENVTNESKDKTQNESSNTDLNGENDTSVNLNQVENQSEERNHNSEDSNLRLDTEDKNAQINDFVSKNKEIENDINNGDTAITSIDENLKESDIIKEESRKDELLNTENAENTSKNIILTKDSSKTAKSIDSTSINDIVNSVEALSVSCVENCSENTNLEGSKSNSGANISDKSVLEAVNDVKCAAMSNTVKECSDGAENLNNTCNYEENTSVKENVVENNSEISNDSKNNSDNINSADNLSQEDTKTEDISENAIGDTNIDKMNINNTENISANTNQTAETNKIASTDGNFDKIDHVETNNTESTANSDKIDALNNTQEISRNTENIHEFDKNGDVDSDNFNMDDLEDVSDTDMDDNKLMDDINEQLNQNNDLNNQLNQNNDLNNPLNENNDLNDQLNQDNDKNDKITLDDLLTKGQNDLDSISDGEFTLDE